MEHLQASTSRRCNRPRRSLARLSALLGSLAMALTGAATTTVTTTSPAVAEDTPTSVTLVGSLQNELGCAEDWAPACTTTVMTDPDGDGVYSYTASVPAGSYEIKVALNGTWDLSYGKNGAAGGENIPLTLAGPAKLTFTWDQASHRLGLRAAEPTGAYTAADDALVAAPVRQGMNEHFYFVLTDRFANGDPSNDQGGLTGGAAVTGFDPANEGYYHGGDLRGIINKLDYIQSLGTTAVWLTPSFTNQPVQGEGENQSAGYHGYWITDFTSIDPHLGGNTALAELRDALHARGMRLYLDIVTNHTADLIDYQEKTYTYVDTATKPYKDASGQVVDISALANTEPFPTLDAATSFPYTPVRRGQVIPAALNDVTLYHNRGDSTWAGESVTMGDFVGLDDLMTENPKVEQTFEEVYKAWIDFGVDGFRIDTAKHVNFEFWQKWTAAIDAHAATKKPGFFTFGEVYDADATKTSPYSRHTGMDATLDFAFQASALGFAKGRPANNLSKLFSTDDYYTTDHSSVYAQPTFLGNHDMGRIGYLLAGGVGSAENLQRDQLAHSLMYLTRGQPVVYYGDEQGFAGTGGDKAARQDMFATQVAAYANQPLVDGSNAGATERYSTTTPLYQHISALAKLRASHQALASGSQVELYAHDDAGVYALARVDRTEKTEYLVALNNSTEAATATFNTLTPGATYTALYGQTEPLSADAAGSVTLTVPALSAVVLKADRQVAAGSPEVTFTTPAGANLSGPTAEIAATTTAHRWAETTFSYRPLGTNQWTTIGTAEDDTPRVFADLSALATGTVLELRAVTVDAAGGKAATSTTAVVGADLTGVAPPAPPAAPIDGLEVTIPGTHNTEMGCGTDWAPDCKQARLTQDPESKLYTGTFEIPAGEWDYKVAIGGSWDENYGANGVAGGDNIRYRSPGGKVTFFYDARSHRVWNNATDPVITLPGSFQKALGCTQGDGNWQPACLASVMTPNGDGTWIFRTDQIPSGSYEVKVAHNQSWDENYGIDGVKGGENYSFSATGGKEVVFTYTLATHLLKIEVADPPLPGAGEQSAYWVDEQTLAWPVSLLPAGVTREQALASGNAGLSWKLFSSTDASAVATPEGVTGEVTGTDLTVTGELPEAAIKAHPNLLGYLALSTGGALDRVAVEKALSGQLLVTQSKDAKVQAVTGVQTAPVLDSLYAQAAGQAPLGVTWNGERPDFALWAPTAQAVTLLTWDTGQATGSAPLAAGDAVRHEAVRGQDGRWTVANTDGKITAGSQYLWEVKVYAPTTGKVEVNTVTDPYSVALTVDSTRSVAVDLAHPGLAPEQWRSTQAPAVINDAARSIYELHVRDFSAGDQSVPQAERGTYLAFTRSDSQGMQHLKALAEAGVNTVHLLPTFDIATVREDRSQQQTAAVPQAGPADEAQQAAVASTADTDAYNWGYDPYHYSAPEGSYATDGHQDGGDRTYQFRQMVGALHATGLQVVLDQVYNHTTTSGQAPTAVLDRVVPGYYQRLNAKGAVETSTCCSNTATENALMERLMVDSVVLWAKQYKVDGFRFDLMGHHSVGTMQRLRAALDQLTVEADGVDGRAIYLYGEGWNFGEVKDDALFPQARQGQLDGTGIGAFNDRLRDGVHGGGPFDSDHRVNQGFGTGQYTDPSGLSGRTEEEERASLLHNTDLVKLGMAGNLKDYELLTADGSVKKGSELDYNGQSAGYASSPQESVNYVDAHDNETLYDLGVYKLPVSTSMADRVRMNTVSLSTVALGQSPAFWAAGTEILRSKSLDRDSYNSGDYFNAIDWSGQDNGFGKGLPVAGPNKAKWDLMRPLLSDPALKPGPADIAASKAQALDLLRIRKSTPLFSLGSAELVKSKVTFPGSGRYAQPGVINMLVDDRPTGERSATGDVDPKLAGVLTVVNASATQTTQALPELVGRYFTLHTVQLEGVDEVVKSATFDPATGTVSVPARTTAVFVEVQKDGQVAPQPQPGPHDGGQPGVSPQPTPTGTPLPPSASGKPGKGLPVTGANAVGLLVVAGTLVTAGTLAVRRRRRA